MTNQRNIRRTPNVWWASWAGYAACAWAVLFSAQSFYYAAGGTLGASTWPPVLVAPVLARDPMWIAIMWGTGAAKVVIGLFALALVQRWGRLFPCWMLLLGAWGLGICLALYGLASWVQHGLMAAGVLAIPAGLGRDTPMWWHFLLWDPWWLLGGILFITAACSFQRRA